MDATAKKQLDTTKPVTVREYDIRGMKYIVKATIRDGASEDTAAKALEKHGIT